MTSNEKMNQAFAQDPNSGELTAHVKNGDMVVFVGSGLSCADGLYPSWWELVEELRKRCGLSEDRAVTEQATSATLQEVARDARNNDRDGFVAVLGEKFAKTIQNNKESYDLLLKGPFAGYVTTNFDPLLAHQLARHDSTKMVHAYPEFDYLQLRSKTVFYLHGYIAQGATPDLDRIVLCKDDFETAYDPNKRNLTAVWEALLTQCAVLFLGCSLGEPELEFIFERCNRVREALAKDHRIKARRRFLLLPAEDGKTAETDDKQLAANNSQIAADKLRRFDKYDIAVVRYDAKPDYSGLVEVLNEWIPAPAPEVYSYEFGDPPYEKP